MNQELPSDTLRKPTRRAPWIIGGISTVAIATAAILAGPSIATQINPAPKPTSMLSPYVSPALTPEELASVQSAADAQQATIAAEAAAKAAAEAQAAAAAAQHHSSGVAAGAPGSRVPFIKSDDPNNANGGDYEDPGIYCQSHSASGNPPVCD